MTQHYIGAVAFIHRFGSSLNEHVHFHVCVVDGVLEAVVGEASEQGTRTTATSVMFHPATGIACEVVALAQASLRSRILRAFVGRGLLEGFEAQEMLGYKHSVFSVETSVCIAAQDRAGLERLLRYCARLPFALTGTPVCWRPIHRCGLRRWHWPQGQGVGVGAAQPEPGGVRASVDVTVDAMGVATWVPGRENCSRMTSTSRVWSGTSTLRIVPLREKSMRLEGLGCGGKKDALARLASRRQHGLNARAARRAQAVPRQRRHQAVWLKMVSSKAAKMTADRGDDKNSAANCAGLPSAEIMACR